MLNGKDIDIKCSIDEVKTKILILLHENKQLYISDMSEKIGVEPETIIQALKELEKEKRIRKAA